MHRHRQRHGADRRHPPGQGQFTQVGEHRNQAVLGMGQRRDAAQPMENEDAGPPRTEQRAQGHALV